MGVSGCGKSTIGKLLATKLQVDFYDADDFHPTKNIEKMRKGIPLNDADRQPWLAKMRKQFIVWRERGGAVLACSALKETYRRFLKEENIDIEFIFLEGSFELILERMKQRKGHFMSNHLLQSQLDTLEIPTYGMHINIDQSPQVIINKILIKINNE